MVKISAVINICNEAHLLRECLESIKNFADEIIISDMESNDNGVEIANEYGAKIIKVKKQPFCEATLIDRINLASGDWILNFDPDMRLPENTAKKLREIAENNLADVVGISFRNFFIIGWSKFGHGSQKGFVKFFKKSLFLSSQPSFVEIHGTGRVLEKTPHKKIELPKRYYVYHIAYTDMKKALEQHLRYAHIEAMQRYEKGEKFSFVKFIYELLKKILKDWIYLKAPLGGLPSMLFSIISEIMIIQIHLYLWELTYKNE